MVTLVVVSSYPTEDSGDERALKNVWPGKALAAAAKVRRPMRPALLAHTIFREDKSMVFDTRKSKGR